ncbi:hypothetical protein [Lentimicrobium sp.]|uniref:hypothetical protein n=1 Tax=Lentimicrobium sp. TaxID=2034841 RepID=UPI0025F1B131|nr:hypothetical protein [Lentimicrobium sp.]MCO5256555.1 hypothetical protein [Lentimicrobium sp.]MCO5261369.1 hypothetical protein [Lentimicrobium sp.]HOP13101.1 hypothetical protein [Lentimicrobium sp.]HPF63887.1 hypothetical protein [Lentimicrobium sp.]HPJ62576.1 hypothetical protein [Lentimicrobium sp.]
MEILLLEGLNELKFGDTPQTVENTLGKPLEIENLGDEADEDLDTILWNYDKEGLTVFFEGKNNHVLSCFETDNEEVTLFGKKIFGLNEQEITALMKENGMSQIDSDEEEWGERRVSFDEGLIDFYFQDGKLVTVNWGVFVNEDGEIEEFDDLEDDE